MAFRAIGMTSTLAGTLLSSLAILALASGLAAQQRKVMTAPPKPVLPSQMVDLNSATADQLKALPGIDDASAAKIIEGRPYKNTRELVKKNVIPESVYERIFHRLFVHAEAAAPKKEDRKQEKKEEKEKR
jgi:DNA uptake protein ComE-like DNA-binding protein